MSPRSGGAAYREVTWRHFVYGGAASCVAEGATFPIDTTKTRLQIQGQHPTHFVGTTVPSNRPIRYTGMLDALRKIPKEEGGIAALYRGISPALLRQSVYGSLKFGAYYAIKKIVAPHYNGSNEMGINVVCAVTAGMTSSAIANPTDVLKIRMQAASTSAIDTAGRAASIFEAFRRVYTVEGIRGLWRGVGPTSQRAGVIAGVELPVYDAAKQYLIDHNILLDSFPNHVASSFLASFTGAVCSTPLDVMRVRMMAQKVLSPQDNRFPTAGSDREFFRPCHVYKNTFDCFVITIRHEGVGALWKGFVPAWLRMGPWNVIFFTTYEALLRFD